MADNRVYPGPLTGCESPKNAVCISTRQVYDSCRDKDCLEDLRVYPTAVSQAVLDRAISVRVRDCEVLCCYIDVEEVPFNNGFYAVDAKFFFKCRFDAFYGCGNPQIIEGICAYNKRVILYGSCGGSKIYSSQYVEDDFDRQMRMRTNLPRAVVEVIDPMPLSCMVRCGRDRCGCSEFDISAVSEQVASAFDGDLVDPSDGNRLYVTLGLFSVIRLERPSQILVPSYEFYLPEKECCGPDDEDPCHYFQKIAFPVDQFSPPRVNDANRCSSCGCGSEPSPCKGREERCR